VGYNTGKCSSTGLSGKVSINGLAQHSEIKNPDVPNPIQCTPDERHRVAQTVNLCHDVNKSPGPLLGPLGVHLINPMKLDREERRKALS
jgi:hypothetical protein